MRIVTNPLDLGTSTYGQSGAVIPFEIEGYGVDADSLLFEFGQNGRVVEFSHDLASWSSFSIYVLPKSLFHNQIKVTIWARIAGILNAGSISGQFGFDSIYGTTSPVQYSGTVVPATLYYTATPVTRKYGDTNPVFTGSITGIVNNDVLSEIVSDTPRFSSPATPSSSRGKYPIIGSGLTLKSSNYVLAQVTANSYALNIEPRKITVKTVDASKIQGEANPGFTVSYDGFVSNEGQGVLGGSLSFSTSATSASVAGLYSVTPGGLISSNYEIRYASGTQCPELRDGDSECAG